MFYGMSWRNQSSIWKVDIVWVCFFLLPIVLLILKWLMVCFLFPSTHTSIHSLLITTICNWWTLKPFLLESDWTFTFSQTIYRLFYSASNVPFYQYRKMCEFPLNRQGIGQTLQHSSQYIHLWMLESERIFQHQTDDNTGGKREPLPKYDVKFVTFAARVMMN